MGDRSMRFQAWRKRFQSFGQQIDPEVIGKYVLVPGSKERVRRFAEAWDDAEEIVDCSEFLLCSGWMNGTKVSACSTGIGGTSVGIAAEELIELGAHTLIRVGVTGTLRSDIRVGDVTIASAAVRKDRISNYFLPEFMPAIASPTVVAALQEASQDLGFRYHTGLSATTGTFYCGEGRPGYNGYSQSFMAAIANDFKEAGVMDWDTETATLFAICLSRGVRAGRVNGVVDSPSSKESDPGAEQKAVKVGLAAIAKLVKADARVAQP